jgi:hypothetical protein
VGLGGVDGSDTVRSLKKSRMEGGEARGTSTSAQGRVRRITAHPILERVNGGARQDHSSSYWPV